MSSWNVPDDWDNYYSRCARCKTQTHASENNACQACDDELGDLAGKACALAVEIVGHHAAGGWPDWAGMQARAEVLVELYGELDDVAKGRPRWD